MTAVERRFDALKTLSEFFLNEDNGYKIDSTQDNRESYVNALAEVAKLGRTDRWRKACQDAKLAALDTDNDLDWVILQHGIFMGYASL